MEVSQGVIIMFVRCNTNSLKVLTENGVYEVFNPRSNGSYNRSYLIYDDNGIRGWWNIAFLM